MTWPEAQRLLDQAGYVDRQDLGEIVVADVGLGVGPAVEVWRDELGARVTVESMDFADYLVALEEDPPQVFTINWIADYPSPYALYSLLLLPRAASNYGGWTDADLRASCCRRLRPPKATRRRRPPTARWTRTSTSRRR